MAKARALAEEQCARAVELQEQAKTWAAARAKKRDEAEAALKDPNKRLRVAKKDGAATDELEAEADAANKEVEGYHWGRSEEPNKELLFLGAAGEHACAARRCYESEAELYAQKRTMLWMKFHEFQAQAWLAEDAEEKKVLYAKAEEAKDGACDLDMKAKAMREEAESKVRGRGVQG